MGVPTPQCLKKPRSQPSIGSNKEKKLPQAEREPRTKGNGRKQKATPRDTIEGRNSCETEGHAGQEQSAKRALQRAVTISAFQRPPQVGMT